MTTHVTVQQFAVIHLSWSHPSFFLVSIYLSRPAAIVFFLEKENSSPRNLNLHPLTDSFNFITECLWQQSQEFFFYLARRFYNPFLLVQQFNTVNQGQSFLHVKAMALNIDPSIIR